jgi:hypothetical protein
MIERECAEHVHWHPYVTVEKYSPEQTAWASARLQEARGWRRLPVLSRVPLGDHRATVRRHEGRQRRVRDLHGDWLRELFPSGPEDGMAYDDGNLLTNTGLTVIIKLLTATGATTYYPLANNGSTNNTVVGVGTTATAATVTDVALGSDNTANAYYQGSDATYPNVTTPATINNQSTFASGNANFAWNEWCWATGAGAVTAGTHLSAIFATGASINMINHKVPVSSLGTKGSGASWVFSTTVVFS